MKLTGMKLILVASIFSLNASAAILKVLGPCSQIPVVQVDRPLITSTLGDWSVSAFQDLHLAFVGNPSGIQSIENSPTGDQALEVLSDQSMRAYGWCVSVDGVQPSLMPDQVKLDSSVKEVVWFYAASLYDKGQWKDMCAPSYKIHSKQICPLKN